jgi:hypothetical protein
MKNPHTPNSIALYERDNTKSSFFQKSVYGLHEGLNATAMSEKQVQGTQTRKDWIEAARGS